MRKVALWVGVGVGVIVAVLWATGSFGPVYRWMVRYMPPEVWSALGTWLAIAAAIVTVLVAGRPAKEQVDEARRTREEQLSQTLFCTQSLACEIEIRRASTLVG